MRPQVEENASAMFDMNKTEEVCQGAMTLHSQVKEEVICLNYIVVSDSFQFTSGQCKDLCGQ